MLGARKFDREAVVSLAGMYASRLGLDPYKDGGTDYAPSQIGRAAIGAATEKNVLDALPELVLHDALICGMDVALAVISDPIGDPREALRAAFERFGKEVKDDADSSRRDVEMAKQSDGASTP